MMMIPLACILPMNIPNKATRRLKTLGFDGSGNPVALDPLTGGTSDSNLVNYVDMEGNAISVAEGITQNENFLRNESIQFGDDTGVADAYVWKSSGSMPNTIADNGMFFVMVPQNTNTGASTV
jgi:hypothetical protein